VIQEHVEQPNERNIKVGANLEITSSLVLSYQYPQYLTGITAKMRQLVYLSFENQLLSCQPSPSRPIPSAGRRPIFRAFEEVAVVKERRKILVAMTAIFFSETKRKEKEHASLSIPICFY
jgi:hypothetical protein